MKDSIKQAIIRYLEAEGEKYGGQIDDHIRELFGSKAGNVGRRCRELENSGVLLKSLVQIDGKGPWVVKYRIKPRVDLPPAYKPTVPQDRLEI